MRQNVEKKFSFQFVKKKEEEKETTFTRDSIILTT